MAEDAAPASRDGEAGAVHVRTYTEYRLAGQPDGDYPYYEHTTHEAHGIAVLLKIWENIQSGRYAWTDVTLHRREVTITHEPWVDISDLRIIREDDLP